MVVYDYANEDTPLLASQKKPGHSPYLAATFRYLALLAFVVATGVVGWLISQRGKGGPSEPDPRRPKDVIEWKSQLIGWMSATLYREQFVRSPPFCLTHGGPLVGSRIPQIRALCSVGLCRLMS